MGVRKGRDELRQRKTQERENVNRSFHGCFILTWATLHAVCGEATRSGGKPFSSAVSASGLIWACREQGDL
jgi:hypothetical protein